MREIKFRAWDKKRERMVMYLSNAHFFSLTEEDNNYIIMQYVGLKDINGKEIYEGDIIELETGGGEEKNIAPVIYDQKRSKFLLENKIGYHGRWCISQEIISICNYKVIGTIHDNT